VKLLWRYRRNDTTERIIFAQRCVADAQERLARATADEAKVSHATDELQSLLGRARLTISLGATAKESSP
jgi:hypothetical protein